MGSLQARNGTNSRKKNNGSEIVYLRRQVYRMQMTICVIHTLELTVNTELEKVGDWRNANKLMLNVLRRKPPVN